MNINLRGEMDFTLSPTSQIMKNRGIPAEKQEDWLDAGWESINDWREMGEENVRQAVALLEKHLREKDPIMIIVDSDCDGLCSSAILANFFDYLKEDEKLCADADIHLIYHKQKQHGFNDLLDELLKSDCKLIISPDGGTNDIEAHKALQEAGIDTLVLDHHLVEDEEALKKSPSRIINIQIGDYPDKALTGAGVVWQFCRAFNEIVFDKKYTYITDQLTDLCAIGNCGDMADYREMEIRAIMNIGLKHLEGKDGTPVNPFLRQLAKKNDYTLKKRGGLNYYSCAFGIVPFINAMTRSGTMEEKKTLIEAMMTAHAFEQVPSSKRGAKGALVPLYQEAVLICDRVKRRQTKDQDEALQFAEAAIERYGLLENKVLIVPIGKDECRQEIVGLAANKLQAKYQRPCLVLRHLETDDGEVFAGSGRNYSMCEIEDFKGELEKTNLTIFQAGHSSAFGTSVRAENLMSLQEKLDEQYADIDFSPVFWVDYAWLGRKLKQESNNILELADLKIYGQNMPPCEVYVEDIPLGEKNVQLLSPDKHPTLKITCGNVSIMKFGSSYDEYQRYCQPGACLRGVFTPNKNEWGGEVSPQLIAEKVELYENPVFVF